MAWNRGALIYKTIKLFLNPVHLHSQKWLNKKI